MKITEQQLRQIISESVKGYLKENNLLKESCGYEPIKEVINKLIDITSSGYIPFSSPAPSSTEMVVKNNVMKAIECLKAAWDASCQLGYSQRQ